MVVIPRALAGREVRFSDGFTIGKHYTVDAVLAGGALVVVKNDNKLARTVLVGPQGTAHLIDGNERCAGYFEVFDE